MTCISTSTLPTPFDRPVALITGASRGFGRSLALQLAKKSIHIIALARTIGALEELDDDIQKIGGSATLVAIDLNDKDRLDDIGKQIFERFNRLDYYIANAAMVGGLMPISHYNPALFEKIMTVNFHAHWRILRSIDGLLRLSKQAHALFISCDVASNPRAYMGPYSISKAALLHAMQLYAAETTDTPICVHAFNPGPMATRLRKEIMPGEPENTLLPPDKAAEYAIDLFTGNKKYHGHVLTFSPNASNQTIVA